ncbi:MAG: hypothetical protein GF355_14880 [Candidatus Eisenbacteria bacterium]|nr:hypothetical protein [Candidatus Eisenbacteria bacterium]
MLRNEIIGNTAFDGGGIMCYEADSLRLQECVVAGNEAANRGGGLITTSETTPAWIDIDRCTFHANLAPQVQDPPAGGGIFAAEGTIRIRSSIVSANLGGGLVASPEAIEGIIHSDYCDVWNNTQCDYYGCTAGEHSISADPELCGSVPAPVPDVQGAGSWAGGKREDAAPWYCLFETSPCNGTGWTGYDMGAGWVGCFSLSDVIFYDNFSDQADDGWTRELSHPDQASVVAGEYCLQSMEDSVRCYVSELWIDDCVLRLDLQPKDMPYAGATEVLLRMSPAGESWYKISLETETQSGSLERVHSGIATWLADFNCSINVGEWHTLEVLAEGGHLQGTWSSSAEGGSEVIFTVDDPEPLGGGTVGLGTLWRPAPRDGSKGRGPRGAQHTHFDHVLVRSGSTSASPLPGPRESSMRQKLRAWCAPSPARGWVEFRWRWLESYGGRASGRSTRVSPVRIEIHDVNGRRVRNLQAPGESGSLSWDRRDSADRRVAAGIYFWSLRALGVQTHGRVLLVD